MSSHFARTVLVMGLCSVFLTGCTTNLKTLFQKPPKSGIQIQTGETKASVFINSQFLDKTPLIKKDLKPGEYYIEIKPDNIDLAPYETSVTLRDGFLSVIIWQPGLTPELSGGVIYELEKLPDKSQTEVSFRSIPDGAILEVAGQDQEFTPTTIDGVGPGVLDYKLSLPSYVNQEHTVDLIAGHRTIVTAKLAKQQTELIPEAISAPTRAATPTQPATATNSATASQIATTATQSASTVNIRSTQLFIDGQEVLRARSGPGVTYDQVGLVKVGQKYPLLSQPNDGWLEIKLENGAAAWISSAYGELE